MLADVRQLALPAPFRWDGEHIAADLPGGHVRFTTRRGGVSAAPYDELNLGDHVGDDPAAVAANRERAAALAGATWADVAWARQVHGTDVSVASSRAGGDGRPAGPGAVPGPDADGQATAGPHPVAVFTADCLPVALVAEGAVAVVHAGWKGAAGDIVTRGIETLRSLGAAGPIAAALGPSARGCCYAVGEEVHAHFAAYDARRDERNLALDAVATAQLRAAGVDAIHDTGLCTLCAPAGLLFSHRRDGGVTGRQAGLAWRA